MRTYYTCIGNTHKFSAQVIHGELCFCGKVRRWSPEKVSLQPKVISINRPKNVIYVDFKNKTRVA